MLEVGRTMAEQGIGALAGPALRRLHCTIDRCDGHREVPIGYNPFSWVRKLIPKVARPAPASLPPQLPAEINGVVLVDESTSGINTTPAPHTFTGSEAEGNFTGMLSLCKIDYRTEDRKLCFGRFHSENCGCPNRRSPHQTGPQRGLAESCRCCEHCEHGCSQAGLHCEGCQHAQPGTAAAAAAPNAEKPWFRGSDGGWFRGLPKEATDVVAPDEDLPPSTDDSWFRGAAGGWFRGKTDPRKAKVDPLDGESAPSDDGCWFRGPAGAWFRGAADADVIDQATGGWFRGQPAEAAADAATRAQKEESLTSWLKMKGFEAFEEAIKGELGVTELEDLQLATPADLESIGIKGLKQKRFFTALAGVMCGT